MRTWSAKLLTLNRYAVTRKHPDGREESLGVTLPMNDAHEAKSNLMEWLLEQMLSGEHLYFQDRQGLRS